MKTIHFRYSAWLILNTLLLTLVTVSCVKQSTDTGLPGSTEEIASLEARGKPITHPQISLKMKVRDGIGDKITSDNGLEYIDGSENVEVYFSNSGNLQFTTTANRKNSMIRHLNYIFDNAVAPAHNNESGGFISSIPSLISPAPYVLQDIPIGNTVCVTLSFGLYTLAGGVVNFHRGFDNEDTQTTQTAFMYVTRDNQTQWTMAPVPPLSGGCSSISNVAALKINGVTNAYYNMPFSFTLTAN